MLKAGAKLAFLFLYGSEAVQAKDDDDQKKEEQKEKKGEPLSVSWDDFESKYGTKHLDYRNLIAFKPHHERPSRKATSGDYEYYAQQDYSVDGYWEHTPAQDSYPVTGAQAVASYLH